MIALLSGVEQLVANKSYHKFIPQNTKSVNLYKATLFKI